MKQLEITQVPKLTFEVKEALNQFRMNLGFCGKNIKKIMITSSLPGEGKSFISFQLWKMLAELNASVLLIDCDLRKSVMKEKLGLRSDDLTTGIEHYLSAQANLEDVIYETNIPN